MGIAKRKDFGYNMHGSMHMHTTVLRLLIFMKSRKKGILKK